MHIHSSFDPFATIHKCTYRVRDCSKRAIDAHGDCRDCFLHHVCPFKPLSSSVTKLRTYDCRSAGSSLQILIQILVADYSDLSTRGLFSALATAPFLVNAPLGAWLGATLLERVGWRFGCELFFVSFILTIHDAEVHAAYRCHLCRACACLHRPVGDDSVVGRTAGNKARPHPGPGQPYHSTSYSRVIGKPAHASRDTSSS
jgi:hypothetical protein